MSKVSLETKRKVCWSSFTAMLFLVALIPFKGYLPKVIFFTVPVVFVGLSVLLLVFLIWIELEQNNVDK